MEQAFIQWIRNGATKVFHDNVVEDSKMCVGVTRKMFNEVQVICGVKETVFDTE